MQGRLSLYHYDGCFYCALVKRAIDKLGISIEYRNIFGDPAHQQDLVRATGRRRVPVLRIDHADGHSEWMPESRDIIRYLELNFG